MEALTFAGSYEDDQGREELVWRVESSRQRQIPSLDFSTSIRGVGLRGNDFDALEPVDASAAAGRLPLDSAGELSECVLSGNLPCTLMIAGRRQPGTTTFSLDLHRHRGRRPGGSLRLSLILDGVTCTVTDDWFEDGVQRFRGYRAWCPPGSGQPRPRVTAAIVCMVRTVGLPCGLAFSELRAILLVWKPGLLPQPGLSSGSPRSATTRRAGSP